MISTPTELQALYDAIKVDGFDHRYLPPERVYDFLNQPEYNGNFKVLGNSVQGRKIGYVDIGSGAFKILAWSQMHGDESTSTRALIDIFSFLNQKEHHESFVQSLLGRFRLRIVFQLNPDGAQAFTRSNANSADLNRDAVTRIQPESQILIDLVQSFNPDLCLNCHDQRSLYSLSNTVDPPHVSFLSAAADRERSLTPARLSAMRYICRAKRYLGLAGFDKIGRYDETYCADCFGDYLQAQKIPTVLIESGHIEGDPQREQSRYAVFVALLGILGQDDQKEESQDVSKCYYAIPENRNMLRDVVLKNILCRGRIVDLGLQKRLALQHGALKPQIYVHDVVAPGAILGYESIDLQSQEILINSHEKDFEGKIIASIVLKKSGLLIKV